jgi:hypothetical protein
MILLNASLQLSTRIRAGNVRAQPRRAYLGLLLGDGDLGVVDLGLDAVFLGRGSPHLLVHLLPLCSDALSIDALCVLLSCSIEISSRMSKTHTTLHTHQEFAADGISRLLQRAALLLSPDKSINICFS